METSKGKICPFMLTEPPFTRLCVAEKCAWWCGFAQDCAVLLLAGMFVDSDVCRTKFKEEP